jgi:hypothetical protein
MWTYNQQNGSISHDGRLVGTGYSGFNSGKNNQAAEQVHDVGPIPRGAWKIGSAIEHHPELGANVLPLTPGTSTDTFGRSGFFIHGENAAHPGQSSHGCIVTGPVVRLAMAKSGDEDFQVI